MTRHYECWSVYDDVYKGITEVAKKREFIFSDLEVLFLVHGTNPSNRGSSCMRCGDRLNIWRIVSQVVGSVFCFRMSSIANDRPRLSKLRLRWGEGTAPGKRTALATKSLYVGNLSYETTEDELKSLFEPWGPVSEVRIVQGRGFGFVDVPEENAAEAIAQTNGKEHRGRTLTVSEARPREPRTGGGGGRGGYGGGGGGYGGGGGRGGGGGGYGGGGGGRGGGGGGYGGGGGGKRW